MAQTETETEKKTTPTTQTPPAAADGTLATVDERNIAAADATEEEESGGLSFGRIVMLSAGGMMGLILLLFVAGLVLVLADAAYWAPIIQVFRDILLIVLTVQGILIITALAVLVLQVARFVNLLRSEIKPITDDAQHALRNIRATTTFVGKNTTQPLISAKGFLAGLVAFLREISRISRLLRRKDDDETTET